MHVPALNLGDLTEEQRLVVTHGEGPAVVIACPGSGKTRALTHRMGYLMQQRVTPAGILGITFTRAAATEMKNRLALLIDPGLAKQVRLYTFHGLAWRLIHEVQGRPNLLDDRGQQALARQLLREFQMNADQTAVEGLLTDFSFYVGAQVPPERFQPTSCEPRLFFDIWTRYGELKTQAGVADFDDLILQARDLLRENPAHQQRQVARTQHLLVDEFQDTNARQWQLLQLLVPTGNNIMVVGDDDQAIYGWRGASPSFMLDFPQHFPGCAELRLTRNFRSTASIITPAGALIGKNTRRFEKRFIAERAPAQAPAFLRPASAAEEADGITRAIQERLAAGANPSDLAVLYRTHLLGLPLMVRLERAGIPFRVIGGRPDPFTRWMARDVLAYLRWAHGEASPEEIMRVLRRPSRRGITKELVQELEQQQVAPSAVFDWLEQRVKGAGTRELRYLRAGLKKLVQTPAGKAITFIRVDMKYDEYIEQYCQWSGSDPQEAREVLSAIEQIPQSNDRARVYIDLAAQEEHRGNADDASAPAVTLASYHGSKGLEWEHVWLLAAVEGAIPHRLTIHSGSPGAMEEERRLFYVGMTRAKNSLTVSAPMKLLGSDASPSRFVTEAGLWAPPSPRTKKWPWGKSRAAVEPETPVLPRADYAPGIVCFHTAFGRGVIHSVLEPEDIMEIRFDQAGSKVFSIEACFRSGLLRAHPHG